MDTDIYGDRGDVLVEAWKQCAIKTPVVEEGLLDSIGAGVDKVSRGLDRVATGVADGVKSFKNYDGTVSKEEAEIKLQTLEMNKAFFNETIEDYTDVIKDHLVALFNADYQSEAFREYLKKVNPSDIAQVVAAKARELILPDYLIEIMERERAETIREIEDIDRGQLR